MRLEKKDWISPRTGFQEFVPNEYCAPCGDGTTMVTYYFWCDAGNGSTFIVYQDPDGDGELSPSEERNQYIGNFYACRESHTVTVEKGTSIDYIFPRGIIGRTEWVDWEIKYVTRPVRIWRGEDGNNIHCTTHLDTSEFTPHNPS